MFTNTGIANEINKRRIQEKQIQGVPVPKLRSMPVINKYPKGLPPKSMPNQMQLPNKKMPQKKIKPGYTRYV